MDDVSPRFLTPEQAARLLGIDPHTLAVWRSSRRYGLPYLKVGRLVRYDSRAVDKWLASRTVEGGAK